MSTKHTGPPGLEKMHSDFRPPLLLGQWRGDAGCTCHGGPTPLPPWSLAHCFPGAADADSPPPVQVGRLPTTVLLHCMVRLLLADRLKHG